MDKTSSPSFELPGFRFHPTEEELLDFYLKNIINGRKMHHDIIGVLNIYGFDPWDLPGLNICIYNVHRPLLLKFILFLIYKLKYSYKSLNFI